ncbi:Glycosyltransferase involved in cell wall bisynthesis [Tenacibaculum sp. MAR_2009_124]|uniref:glycosyltransferase n=1 Tax=Tenacibaculum sp. MAR_2009_124 TaxID=1250059 RepID=UPI0008955F13|nr:glycosyltransferase [Tenacibaculum sp. MAR_2009_124]SEC83392.1 Glycosyltransferase involved in cell wall bisynthesis [Tenacibaculum sp. MAR_2009_124]
MKKIIVSVTNDISNDQRVSKVCDTLYNLNFNIILVGRKLPTSQPLHRNYKTKRFRLLFNNGFLFYAEFNIRLFFYLLFSKSDILLSNDLDTLLPNFIVSKLKGKKLVYDSHELFPEIPELVKRPKTKKIWESLENLLLPRLKNCYTVSQSIADYYQEKYNTHFDVVRNVPKKVKTNKITNLPFNIKGKKVILYQGAVNLGRGLKLMIETISNLDNCIFLIVGDGDIFQNLKEFVDQKNLNAQVIFLGKLSPEELRKITPNAHLGLSIEEDLGLSYRYALPNKLFDYIQAKIPVITSNLPEMKNIVSQYSIGEVLENRTPESFAIKIKHALKKDYSKNLEKAKTELTWENEEQVLIFIFKHLA